ncbi:TetR/AcrR family transcriptional regulator [Nocardioides sp.]|uniref:TetR/AcrR family transcriptional regulator n=1 Tax=Nocardioides sp. TaxID=35761 RepID=UPI0019B4782B|nr:TetR/AcrR family transcriptional regulator [Nocardioides sp.]MBC7279069.1 TetR/AcrR family transcriptional regulator [Nocardioides sp.]
MNSSESSDEGGRPYHHGDLRNALVDAAATLAEEGGPDAVTIRAAARAVGVTPTATYRHFANQADLLHAAKHEAMDRLAGTILDLLASEKPAPHPAEAAVQRLAAAGRGYIRFALAQPGLFRTAFLRPHSGDAHPSTEISAILAEAPPYAFLTTVLDDLRAAGWLAPELRPDAETAAWAAVHGLAVLLVDGPYGDCPDTERDRLINATLGMVVRGLSGGPASDAPLNAE